MTDLDAEDDDADASPSLSVQVIDGLVRNAIEFLSLAMKSLPSTPKHSVHQFAIALELLLKARLCSEHWTLIVRDPGAASADRLRTGDFVSISPAQAIERIQSICGERIPKVERDAYATVIAHRNRMLHFFLGGSNDGGSASATYVEQVRAWDCLIRRLTGQWSSWAGQYKQDLMAIDYSMRTNAHYIQTKAAQVKGEIEAHQKSGDLVLKCSGCAQTAVPVALEQEFMNQGICLVCRVPMLLISVECPECKKPADFADPDEARCGNCGARPGAEALAAAVALACDADQLYCVNCAYRSAAQTAVWLKHEAICLACAERHESTSQCEWCNEQYAGTLKQELTYLSGCELCDGKAGWDKD